MALDMALPTCWLTRRQPPLEFCRVILYGKFWQQFCPSGIIKWEGTEIAWVEHCDVSRLPELGGDIPWSTESWCRQRQRVLRGKKSVAECGEISEPDWWGNLRSTPVVSSLLLCGMLSITHRDLICTSRSSHHLGQSHNSSQKTVELPLLKSRFRICGGVFPLRFYAQGPSHLFFFCHSHFLALLVKTIRYSPLFDHTDHFKLILLRCYGYISIADCLCIWLKPKTNSSYATKCSNIMISRLFFLANNKHQPC